MLKTIKKQKNQVKFKKFLKIYEKLLKVIRICNSFENDEYSFENEHTFFENDEYSFKNDEYSFENDQTRVALEKFTNAKPKRPKI